MTKTQGLAVQHTRRGRLAALALGAALCLSALPAAAQHGRESGNRGNHNGWDRRHGEHRNDRRYGPAPNYSAPLFGFGLFGPAIVQRPHYAPPPPVYYAPPPRGYYNAPPPAYYGY